MVGRWTSGWASVGWVSALSLLLVAGCGGGGMTWERGEKLPGTARAGADGIYSLYQANAKTPTWSGYLTGGDRYGFRKSAGEVVAFTEPYGNIRLLDSRSKSYQWRFEGETRRTKQRD